MVKVLSIAVVLVFAGILIWFVYNDRPQAPIDGTTLGISYTNASEDLIVVSTPTPGEDLPKQFTVSGNARGMWYFEASFPVEVRDDSHTVLWQGPATANGEWMTTDFVPFSVEVNIASAYTGVATLVLKKDNPSGLPEHDASVEFPIIIE